MNKKFIFTFLYLIFIILYFHQIELKGKINSSPISNLNFQNKNFISSLSLNSIIITDTIKNDDIENKAKYFLEKMELDSALYFYKELKSFYEKDAQFEKYINAVNNIGKILTDKGYYDSALVILNSNLDYGLNIFGENNYSVIQTRLLIGSVKYKMGKLNEALEITKNTLIIQQKYDNENVNVSDNYFLQGQIYYALGNIEQSLYYHNIALDIRIKKLGIENSSTGSSYNSIGMIYNIKGDYQNALDYYFKALNIKIKNFGENYYDVSVLYSNIAATYFAMGENDIAIEYYLKSASIRKNIMEEDNPSFGFLYNNLAMAFRVNEDFNNALKYSELAKQIFTKKLGVGHFNTAGIINNIGRIYSDLSSSATIDSFSVKIYLDSALQYYNLALNIFINKIGEKNPTTAQGFFNVGEIYQRKGDFENALDYLNKSIGSYLAVFGIYNIKLSQCYLKKADIYLDYAILNKGKNIDSVFYYINKSILSLNPSVKNFNYDNLSILLEKLSTISEKKELLNSIFLLAKAFNQKYYLITNSNDDLRLSLNFYILSREITEKIRRSYKSENVKYKLNKLILRNFENGIITALQLFENTNDSLYLEEAFNFSEKSKAGILIDAINEVNAKKFSKIPDSLLLKEKELKIQLSFLETQIEKVKNEVNKKENSTNNSSIIQNYEEQIFKLNRDYESLLNIFEKNYESYFHLKYKTQKIYLSEIQTYLKNQNSNLIEYLVGNKTLFIFLITSENIIIKQIPIEKNFSELIYNLKKNLQNIDIDSYLTTSYKLYKILIQPIQEYIKEQNKLIIIPDGILNYLPFEILTTINIRSFSNVDFSSIPYLINEYEINYHYSVSILLEEIKKINLSYNKNHIDNIIGFAPVHFDINSQNKKIITEEKEDSINIFKSSFNDGMNKFSDLPETKREISEIKNLFLSFKKNAEIFIYNDAKEEILKSKKIKDYNFIHFATHGFINEEKPKLSGLVFYQDNNSNEDEILYFDEIFNLDLNAKLIVLSACESGLGKIFNGEGMMGLTRGFFYAGADNIIVSLWQVADKSTSKLMVELYKNILNGLNFSSALRKAKLKLIKEKKYSYPLEWGAFVLIGRN